MHRSLWQTLSLILNITWQYTQYGMAYGLLLGAVVGIGFALLLGGGTVPLPWLLLLSAYSGILGFAFGGLLGVLNGLLVSVLTWFYSPRHDNYSIFVMVLVGLVTYLGMAALVVVLLQVHYSALELGLVVTCATLATGAALFASQRIIGWLQARTV